MAHRRSHAGTPRRPTRSRGFRLTAYILPRELQAIASRFENTKSPPSRTSALEDAPHVAGPAIQAPTKVHHLDGDEHPPAGGLDQHGRRRPWETRRIRAMSMAQPAPGSSDEGRHRSTLRKPGALGVGGRGRWRLREPSRASHRPSSEARRPKGPTARQTVAGQDLPPDTGAPIVPVPLASPGNPLPLAPCSPAQPAEHPAVAGRCAQLSDHKITPWLRWRGPSCWRGRRCYAGRAGRRK